MDCELYSNICEYKPQKKIDTKFFYWQWYSYTACSTSTSKTHHDWRKDLESSQGTVWAFDWRAEKTDKEGEKERKEKEE